MQTINFFLIIIAIRSSPRVPIRDEYIKTEASVDVRNIKAYYENSIYYAAHSTHYRY